MMVHALLVLQMKLSVLMAEDAKKNHQHHAKILLTEPQLVHASLTHAAHSKFYFDLVTVNLAQEDKKPTTMEGNARLKWSAQATRETMAAASASKTTVAEPRYGIFKEDASIVLLVKNLRQVKLLASIPHQPASHTPDCKPQEQEPTGAEQTHATSDKSFCSTVLVNTAVSTQESRQMAGRAPRMYVCSQDRFTLRTVPALHAHNTPLLVLITMYASNRISIFNSRVRDQSELATTMVFSAFLVTLLQLLEHQCQLPLWQLSAPYETIRYYLNDKFKFQENMC